MTVRELSKEEVAGLVHRSGLTHVRNFTCPVCGTAGCAIKGLSVTDDILTVETVCVQGHDATQQWSGPNDR